MFIHFYYWQITPLLIPVAIALVMCGVVVTYAMRHRSQPLANALMWAAGICGFWVFARLMAYATIDLTIKHYWHKAEYFGIVALPVATLIFALHYVRRGDWVTRRSIIFAGIIPAISLTLLLTTELHGLMWRARPLAETIWGPMPYSVYGPWFWVHAAYCYGCTLLGSFLILTHLWQSQSAYRWQAFNIVLALLTPIAANLLFLTKLQPVWLDITPSAFAVTMFLLAWDIYHLRLFNVVPIARRVIFDMLGDGVIVLTHDARIADINPAAAKIFGVDIKASLGSKVEKIFPRLQKALALADPVNQSVEFHLHDSDKTIRWFQLKTQPIKLQTNQAVGHVLVLHDIGEQKQNEQTLAHARDAALAADRTKTQLLGKVSHELRTPLSVIMSYAEIIQRQSELPNPSSTKQHASATTIINYARHLGRLVNDLLDTAQLESGKTVLNKALFSVQDLAEHAINQNHLLADHKGIALSHTIDSTVPEMLFGDKDRILQILNNLVSNAIKFTDQGSVRIHLCRPSEFQWAIQVVDTGPGIPSDAHQRIFEPFQQLENNATNRHGGYGLGLAIVHQLAQLMHGEVVIDSEVGQGSTFTILLPLELDELK